MTLANVEFFGERKILDAWADLFAHYRTDYNARGVPDNEVTRLHLEKYATLVYEMGQVLGYQFGKTHIRDDIYRPDIHNEIDDLEIQTRRLTRDLLKDLVALDALPVRFMPPANLDQVSAVAPTLPELP